MLNGPFEPLGPIPQPRDNHVDGNEDFTILRYLDGHIEGETGQEAANPYHP